MTVRPSADGQGRFDVGGPKSLDSLHKMKTGPRPADRDSDPLERTLDALLEAPKPAADGSDALGSPEESDPIALLRRRFADEIMPSIEGIAERYGDKGIFLSVQASDFLSGGRTLVIEIAFGEHRSQLEGVVTSDGIAFQEARFVDTVPGTVSGGPMLRMRQLADDALSQYVFDRIISLVHESKRTSNG
jgi:hypothetical protein